MFRYLRVIPTETISVYSKGSNKPDAVKKPLARSVDLVEANVKVTYLNMWHLFIICMMVSLLFTQCLCVLAQETETKEQLALLIVQPLLFALDVSSYDLIVHCA